MVRSPGFGSTNGDFSPSSGSLSLWLRLFRLNLPPSVSRRLILQQAHGQTFNRPPIACRLTVSCSISLPSPGFFSPFPRGTVSLSVTQEYLALRGGPRGFTRNFTCSVLLGIQLGPFSFRVRGFHPLWRAIQTLPLTSRFHIAVPQPRWPKPSV